LPDDRPAALVIIYFMAVLADFGARHPVAILVAVQNDLDPAGMQRPELVIYHNNAAVIVGIRDVEGNDMKKHGAKIQGFGM
jgi:hypothetical protein